jgi:hypothetical protein
VPDQVGALDAEVGQQVRRVLRLPPEAGSLPP